MSTTVVTTSGTTGTTLSGVTWLAIALVVIGALNWGLVGLFQIDVVAALFGQLSPLSRVVYVIVAIAGIYLLVMAFARLREVRRAGPLSVTP